MDYHQTWNVGCYCHPTEPYLLPFRSDAQASRTIDFDGLKRKKHRFPHVFWQSSWWIITKLGMWVGIATLLNPIYCRSGRMHTSCMSEFGLYQARLSAFSPSFSWIFFSTKFQYFFFWSSSATAPTDVAGRLSRRRIPRRRVSFFFLNHSDPNFAFLIILVKTI